MNKILKLFDETYVRDYIDRKIALCYPGHGKVMELKIRPHKKMVWESTYHVVVEYDIQLDGGKRLSVFGTAHSDESRKELYKNLAFLQENGFDGRDNLLIPKPLFYSKQFNCFFYEGIEGENLHHYIKQADFEALERFLPLVAAWFAKLHGIPYQAAKELNDAGSRISSVVPGIGYILEKVREKYPELIVDVSDVFGELIRREDSFMDNLSKRWVVHGDAHPENIIVVGDCIGVIDFSDLCWSDFARDVGTFLEQFYYMSSKRTDDVAMIGKLEKLFLDNYLKSANIELDESIEERIGLYKHWTMMRMVTVFLLREDPNPDKAVVLIEKVKEYLRTTHNS